MSLDDVMAQFVGKTRAACLDLAAELLGRPLPENFPQSWDTALFQALPVKYEPSRESASF